MKVASIYIFAGSSIHDELADKHPKQPGINSDFEKSLFTTKHTKRTKLKEKSLRALRGDKQNVAAV